MTFKAAKCPNCGGDLQVPADKDFIICMYCGTNVKVREAIKIAFDNNIPNWLLLANTALDAGNNQEAYDYFNKILEADHKHSGAWQGKAQAAGRLSTLANLRLTETVSAFRNAVEYSPEEEKHDTGVFAAEEITALAASCFNLSLQHMNEFFTLDNVWDEHIERCGKIINALEAAHQFDPQNINTVELIIAVCDDNIKGKVFIIHGAQKNKLVSPQYKNDLLALRNKYLNILHPPGASAGSTSQRPAPLTDAQVAKNKNRNMIILFSVIGGLILLFYFCSRGR